MCWGSPWGGTRAPGSARSAPSRSCWSWVRRAVPAARGADAVHPALPSAARWDGGSELVGSTQRSPQQLLEASSAPRCACCTHQQQALCIQRSIQELLELRAPCRAPALPFRMGGRGKTSCHGRQRWTPASWGRPCQVHDLGCTSSIQAACWQPCGWQFRSEPLNQLSARSRARYCGGWQGAVPPLLPAAWVPSAGHPPHTVLVGT